MPHLDINSEFKTYGRYMLILLKTEYSGGPLMLGKGSVRFDALKKALKNKVKPNYIIFQSYRDNKPAFKATKMVYENVL